MQFTAVAQPRPGGGIAIRVPVDPATLWGERERHHVAGEIERHPVRGVIEFVDDAPLLRLGPAWCRDPRVGPGATLHVSLHPEGPQVATLAVDIAAAFASAPAARRAFEGLATFYRNGFIRPIEGAKRPDTRARRITEMIDALEAKDR
jgi:hypothetical protein